MGKSLYPRPVYINRMLGESTVPDDYIPKGTYGVGRFRSASPKLRHNRPEVRRALSNKVVIMNNIRQGRGL